MEAKKGESLPPPPSKISSPPLPLGGPDTQAKSKVFKSSQSLFTSAQAFRPHEDDENAHRKRINSKTLSKVDKFENAVYASSCGRP